MCDAGFINLCDELIEDACYRYGKLLKKIESAKLNNKKVSNKIIAEAEELEEYIAESICYNGESINGEYVLNVIKSRIKNGDDVTRDHQRMH